MVRMLIGAAVFAALSAASARAQITDSLPGYGLDDTTVFSYGLGPEYEQTRSLEQLARDREIERQYRDVVSRRIPDRKASNDPWKNIRSAPSASAYDRHRVQ